MSCHETQDDALGRKPIGKRAMTAAERQRARRKRLLDERPEMPIKVTRHDHSDSIRIEIVITGGDDEETRERIARFFMKKINRIGVELK
jgi:hypothetical protein